jgi:hypothetical protein
MFEPCPPRGEMIAVAEAPDPVPPMATVGPCVARARCDVMVIEVTFDPVSSLSQAQ